MEKTLKERLAGGVVLFLVAVIFIPAILSESPKKKSMDLLGIVEESQVDAEANIVDTVKKSEQEYSLVSIQDDQIDVPETHVSVESNTRDISEPQSMIKNIDNQDLESKNSSQDKDATQDANNLHVWTVQLGSFTRQKNADILNTKLRDAGYSSFIEPISKDKEVNYRVRIGKETKRADAEMLLEKIRKDFGIKAILVNYIHDI